MMLRQRSLVRRSCGERGVSEPLPTLEKVSLQRHDHEYSCAVVEFHGEAQRRGGAQSEIPANLIASERVNHTELVLVVRKRERALQLCTDVSHISRIARDGDAEVRTRSPRTLPSTWSTKRTLVRSIWLPSTSTVSTSSDTALSSMGQRLQRHCPLGARVQSQDGR